MGGMAKWLAAIWVVVDEEGHDYFVFVWARIEGSQFAWKTWK